MKSISALFQRVAALFLAILSFFSFGRGTPAPESPAGDVLLVFPVVTTATKSFDVTIETRGKSVIGYGVDGFSIEKETAAGWVLLPKTGNYAVIEILMLLEPGASTEFHVDLKLCYGKPLAKGNYRFNFSYYEQSGDRGSASAVFQVET